MFVVMQRSKMFNELLFREHGARELPELKKEDAIKLAKSMATIHSWDCVVPEPVEVEPGIFRFYTSNYSMVEYFVIEIVI